MKNNIPILCIKAKGFQVGNPPQNVIDNNNTTRGSHEGID